MDRLRIGILPGVVTILTSCQLGELVWPHDPARLMVTPPALVDSAATGATQPRTAHLTVQDDRGAGARWHADMARGSAWATLGSAEGTAPGSLAVSLSARTLAAGEYTDTIVVRSTDWPDDVTLVPVRFTVESGTSPPPPPPPGPHSLTVSGAGLGSGSVSSTPAGISCPVAAGGAWGDCSEDYAPGTVVTLTPDPATGSAFDGWSGACSGTGTCQVTMTGTRLVTATFRLLGTLSR